jgi:hypothetical protein
LCAAGAFAIALAIVLLVRIGAPPGNKLGIALKATARWSFLLFWLASGGGALATLLGRRFATLAAQARNFGLSYAAAQLVHLGLVAWLYYFLPAPRQAAPAVFVIAAFCTYMLALLSINRFSQMFSPILLRSLRVIGVEYIGFAFLIDFAKDPFQGGAANLFSYLPFQILAVLGPLLRLAAFAKRMNRSRGFAATRP